MRGNQSEHVFRSNLVGRYSRSCQSLRFEVGGWAEAWGWQKFGFGAVAPYFAVRITRISEEERPALMIGVDAHQFVDYRPKHRDGLSPALAIASEQSEHNGQRVRTGCLFGSEPVSHFLATVIDPPPPQPQYFYPVNNPPPPPPMPQQNSSTDGFLLENQLVGVVCDLEQNSLSFYLNDQPLLVGRDTPPNFDLIALIKQHNTSNKPHNIITVPGVIFSFSPDPARLCLKDCYPFIACAGVADSNSFVELSLVPDWIPPHLRS